MNPIPTLSGHRITKLTERVAMLERELIEQKALLLIYRINGRIRPDEHYRTLAENELIREGLVRPRNVREMEVRGNGQKEG